MKLSNLPFITFNQLSAIATAISNTRVQGLKANTKKLLQAFAQNEEVSEDALKSKIQKIHDDAYYFQRKKADFVKFPDGKVSLVCVDIDINVNGYSSRTISIYNSVLDFDAYCMTANCFPNIAFNNGDRDMPIEKRLHNLQWATNAAFELCQYLNSNRKVITAEDLKKQGFDVDIKETQHTGTGTNEITFSESLEYKDIRVHLDYSGEGYHGDYDPSDEDDKPLLRYSIEQKIEGEWQWLKNASYCTDLTTDLTKEQAKDALLYLAKKAHPSIEKGYWKRVCEELSWVSIKDVSSS